MSKPTSILFVHGAWANSSAWAKVLPIVERVGVKATAVQLPLTSLADDAAALKRAIALVEGDVLLVGHSYGGAVMTEAGNDPRVSGLAYVTGFAPAAGESVGSLGAGGPPTRLPETLVPDTQGFLKLSRQGVDEAFAQDLSNEEKALVFATRSPCRAMRWAVRSLHRPGRTSRRGIYSRRRTRRFIRNCKHLWQSGPTRRLQASRRAMSRCFRNPKLSRNLSFGRSVKPGNT